MQDYSTPSFAQPDTDTADTVKPAAEPKRKRTSRRKSKMTYPSITDVAALRQMFSSIVDTENDNDFTEPCDPRTAIEGYLEAGAKSGLAYLANGKEIYAVVLSPDMFDKLLKKEAQS